MSPRDGGELGDLPELEPLSEPLMAAKLLTRAQIDKCELDGWDVAQLPDQARERERDDDGDAPELDDVAPAVWEQGHGRSRPQVLATIGQPTVEINGPVARHVAGTPQPRSTASAGQSPRGLSVEHRDHLRTSGLTDKTLALAGLYTERDPRELKTILGRPYSPKHGYAIVIPFFLPGATEPHENRIRPDKPRVDVNRNGKKRPVKYDQRRTENGGTQLVYFPPRARLCGWYADVSRPCVHTEGEKKGLLVDQLGYACLAYTGVNCWHDKAHRVETAEWKLHPAVSEHVAIAGRDHVLCFDADARTNPNVRRALDELARTLLRAGARSVRFALPPSDGPKGIDDYFVERGEDATRELIERGGEELVGGANDNKKKPDDSDLPQLGVDLLPQGVEPETGLAQAHRLAQVFGGELRHDSAHWRVWDGRVWRHDATAAMGRAMKISRAVVRRAFKQLLEVEKKRDRERDKEAKRELDNELEKAKAVLAWARRQQERNALSNVLELASNLAPIATTPEVWDRDLLALNCRNGTVDLRSGELRPHRCEDMLTQCIELDYDPHASAPQFEAFLAEVQPDAEVRAYLQRVAGYAAVGVVREHVLVVWWGPGCNGKSVCAGAIESTLGPYACTGADSLITRTGNHEPHPTDVAACCGTRLVLLHETQQGAAFDASKVKKLTGGDKLTARRMRQDYFDFEPTHTLIMLTNYRPHGDASDAALWRRIHLVPWDVTIPPDRVDEKLSERLHLEAQGVLAWIVRGAVEWQSRGLAAPKTILDQTAAYRSAEDVVGQYIDEECIVAGHAQCRGGELYTGYKRWCEVSGQRARNNNDFAAELHRRKFVKETRSTGAWYRGIAPKRESVPASAEGA